LSWVGGARAKDPGDPLLHSERTQGFTADPGYWKGEVFVYVGRNQNLKDLKVTHLTSSGPTHTTTKAVPLRGRPSFLPPRPLCMHPVAVYSL